MVARVTRLVAEKFVLSTFPRALTMLSSMCSRAVRALESSPGLIMMMDNGLQTRICNRHDIAITIAHYPSGTSKWNPVEHRLFSEISKNWAGRPLDSYETILKYIRTTTTSSGLRVRAHLIRRRYPKGVKITDERMQALSVTKDQTLPKWNYTIRPS